MSHNGMSGSEEDGAGAALRILPILRDVLIIFGLTFLSGFVVGFLFAFRGASGTPAYAVALGLSNLVFGTVGFVISGCLAPPGRWRHLLLVAVGVWLLSLANVAFMGVPFLQWAFLVIPIAIIMGVGGGLSYLFRR
ncbi:MAG TPA: hypothetical protein VKS60_23510 [Stellaceae bacterium]|nr:hypothetical protein [Stellaceae bacterium]